MPVVVPPGQPRIADYLASDDERPFIHKALDERLGDDDRLAYARLVEARDPGRAEWLRLEVALHARAADDPAVIARFIALAHQIGLEYANLLLREKIMNCGSEALRKEPRPIRFAFACSERWQTLAPTELEAVRFCQRCEERVYHCDTIADAETRAFAGQCIALPRALSDGGGVDEAVLGRPDPVREWAGRLFTLGPGARATDRLLVLYSREQKLTGQTYALGTTHATTLGRGADSTILLDGDGVSRSHARLERRADGWWVIDAGSTNGTYVNDEPVQEKLLLDGDRITVGQTILKLVERRR